MGASGSARSNPANTDTCPPSLSMRSATFTSSLAEALATTPSTHINEHFQVLSRALDAQFNNMFATIFKNAVQKLAAVFEKRGSVSDRFNVFRSILRVVQHDNSSKALKKFFHKYYVDNLLNVRQDLEQEKHQQGRLLAMTTSKKSLAGDGDEQFTALLRFLVTQMDRHMDTSAARHATVAQLDRDCLITLNKVLYLQMYFVQACGLTKQITFPELGNFPPLFTEVYNAYSKIFPLGLSR